MKAGPFIFVLALCMTACKPGADKNKEQFPANLLSESDLNQWMLNKGGQPTDQRLKRLDSMLMQTGKDSANFYQVINYLKQPLGNPNSPYRNEDLYIRLLQAELQSGWTDSLRQSVLREKLFLLMQNRSGEPANDFTYITPEGKEKRMYDIKADYLLLFFYNPECEACKEMKAALKAAPFLNKQQQNGRLKVLAVYTDRDETVWRRHLPENPKQWLNGRDKNEYLYKHHVYNLQAIPTLYLLDGKKKVLLKDCMDLRAIEEKISGGE